MRTTVTIDPDVEVLVRKAMRQRDASFKQVLNDSLREALAERRPKPRAPYRQVAYHLGRPLVDLTKATALAAELDDLELAAKLRRGR